MKKVICTLAAMLLCTMAVLAADVTGKWTAEVPGRDGATRTIAMTLKADGATLTGSMGGRQGDTAISDGKIDGDNISFNVVREMNGNSMKIHYEGTVAGDTIKFKSTMEGGNRPPQEFTAKKAQ